MRVRTPRFLANAAWLLITTLAHKLLRWVATIGLGTSDLVVAKTLRRRLLAVPGRLTRSARRRLLHLPRDWPWARQFLGALAPSGQSRCGPDVLAPPLCSQRSLAARRPVPPSDQRTSLLLDPVVTATRA